jgi:hypothetical protein
MIFRSGPILVLIAFAAAGQPRDPAAWGHNHAGQPVPDYVHGDECLFCHRETIGNTWQKNRHGLTLRQREDAPELEALPAGQPKLAVFAKQVTHFLGSRQVVRYLAKDGYGKFDILTTAAEPGWDKNKFADRCAGCHATGVDESKTFSAFGLDCYACHGAVDLNHTHDISLVWLSKKKRGDTLAIISICAQCHLRGGRARSTGLPYPNNFVAGDNLFQDYLVDFAKADDPKLSAGERHIYRNVRDVAVNGSDTTCLSCHRIHGDGARKHRLALTNDSCLDCHNASGPKKEVKLYAVHSELCEY